MDRTPNQAGGSSGGYPKASSQRPSHNEVSRKLKQDYAHGSKDPSNRGLSSLDTMIKLLADDNLELNVVLGQAAKLVFTQLNIREVSIALRSASDDKFRYVAMHGMRTEIWAAHKSLSYTEEEVLNPKKHKHTAISNLTRLFLAEDNPYAEDEAYTYSEHLSAISKRMTLDDSIEGDYLDVFIYSPDDRLLGWIETGSTWGNKIPDARTIRCLELLASILGVAITRCAKGVEKTKDVSAAAR